MKDVEDARIYIMIFDGLVKSILNNSTHSKRVLVTNIEIVQE
jgi:hypothetical protein